MRILYISQTKKINEKILLFALIYGKVLIWNVIYCHDKKNKLLK